MIDRKRYLHGTEEKDSNRNWLQDVTSSREILIKPDYIALYNQT